MSTPDTTLEATARSCKCAASQRAEAVHARDNRQINSACGLLHLGNISTRSHRQPAKRPAEFAQCCVLSAGQGASSTCRIYIFICFPEASSQAPKSLPITCTTCSALLSLLSHPPTHICSHSVQSQQGWLRSEQSSSDFTWNCAHKANVSQRSGTTVRIEMQVAYSAQRQIVRQDPAPASAAGFAGTGGTSST